MTVMMKRRISSFCVILFLVITGALIIILDEARMFCDLQFLRNQHELIKDSSGSTMTHTIPFESDGLSRYGKPVKGMNHVIVYNSVPKCGSRTFGCTARRLFRKKDRDIKYFPMLVTVNNTNIPPTKSQLETKIKDAKPPAFCAGRGDFVPVELRPQPPVYINFIRDPVSRMVSLFYFSRFGDSYLRMGVSGPTQNMTIEECILGHRGECTRPGIYPQIFCGFSERCESDHAWALEQAKANVDKYYTFIGITEEYGQSLQVLERLLPDMFGGLYDVYRTASDGKNMSELSKTNNKKPLSPELTDTVRKLYEVDYEFYNYVYDRFRMLKRQYGIE